MTKKYTGSIIAFYVLAVASLITATLFDLKIDIFLNNPSDIFSNWFYQTGEMPNSLILPLAGTVLLKLAEKKITRIAGLIIEMGGSIYLGCYIADYCFKDENDMIFGAVYGFGFGLVLLLVAKYIKLPETVSRKALLMLAFAGIAVMVLQLGIVNIAKVFWGRVRMRDLIAAGSYDQFTSWLHPNGINGNKSFPSGHTASAGMSYLMMLLPYASDKWKEKKNLCFIVPFVYTSTVAFTRMVMGAHYLSDVTMGGIIAFTLVVIAVKVIEKQQAKLTV